MRTATATRRALAARHAYDAERGTPDGAPIPSPSEVMRNGLLVAVEEASRVVVRSAHSTFIQEGADACAALLDTAGQLVAQSTSTSLMHSVEPALQSARRARRLRAGRDAAR